MGRSAVRRGILNPGNWSGDGVDMSSRVVDLKQAQSCLEELVGQAARGEEVILTREGQPVAKIIPVMQRVAQRRFGSARGLIRTRSDFDEPLEDFRDSM